MLVMIRQYSNGVGLEVQAETPKQAREAFLELLEATKDFRGYNHTEQQKALAEIEANPPVFDEIL